MLTTIPSKLVLTCGRTCIFNGLGGFSACPNDAVETNKEVANYICRSGGGEGCVREFAELIKFNFIKSRKLKVEI